MIVLVSPTEHDLHEFYRNTQADFQVSSVPEQYGADLLVPTKRGLVAFQRKTLPDLQSSLLDGRLYKELGQLTCAPIRHSFLIIESRLERTTTGELFDASSFTIQTLRSLIAKFAANGIGYLPSVSIGDTAATVEGVSRYLASGDAELVRRPKQTIRDGWGKVSTQQYALFLLQSFPSIGPKLAQAILDHFQHVPLQWSVTEADLQHVPGIGPKLAKQLIESLQTP